jgi:5-methylcytosine-specific restriction endonuclease McrA
MWSRKFNECVNCNTTNFPHVGKGLCDKCYNIYHWETIKYNPIRYKKHLEKQLKNYHNLPKEEKQKRGKLNREQRYFSGKREFILKRDNYKCQLCGEKNNLVVHHKDGNGRGVIKYNNKYYNLITLCRKCHLQIHFKGHSFNKLPENKWSKNFECCKQCKTTKTPHNSHGLCNNCYAFYKRYKLPNGKWKLKQKCGWSINYSKCRKCNSISRKHVGHGLCCNCYVVEKTHNRLNLWIND